MFRNPPLLLTFSICAALLLPALFMDGMFMDGVQYVSVARNFGFGHGTFWEPMFSLTRNPHFHDQPPLLFFLEGIFFKILGDGFYTERIYCLFCAVLNIFLIHKCWKNIRPGNSTSWLPVLVWFIMPVIFWAFTNNVEEITMSVFVLAAMSNILFALRNKKKALANWFFAGGFILLAGLCKGVQGMFLISAPFFAWIILKNGTVKDFFLRSIMIFLVPGIFILYAWLTPAVRDSFHSYYVARILNTFTSTASTSETHFHLLKELWLSIIPSLLLVAFLLFIFRKKISPIAGFQQEKKMILFLFAIAFSGMLPLMITLEQRAFYLVTALPFLAMALSLLTEQHALHINTFLKSHKRFSSFILIFSIIIFAGTFSATVFLWGKPKRDVETLAFLKRVSDVTGKDKIICTSVPTNSNWAIVMYAERYYQMSLRSDLPIDCDWYITNNSDTEIPQGFEKTSVSSPDFTLYQKNQR